MLLHKFHLLCSHGFQERIFSPSLFLCLTLSSFLCLEHLVPGDHELNKLKFTKPENAFIHILSFFFWPYGFQEEDV